MSHTACANCGFYRGREVINVMKKLEKREKKAKAKQQGK
jgi:large subunit ribosomal protein L32